VRKNHTLRKRLFWWGERLTDYACDLPTTRWTWLNDLPFTLAEAAQRAACRVFGHYAIPDHCGIPAHDQCAWCRTRMPNAAGRT
jgi:hypothetical protein